MSPLSKPALVQARNNTAARPTTVTSLQFRPTGISLSTGRLPGYYASFSNTSSTLPYQTGFSTRVAATTPSAALTTPLSYANHSTSASVMLPLTHSVPISQTTKTLEAGHPSPTSDLTLSADSPIPTLEQARAMSLETKIGLALVPIAAGLCIWGLVLLFLWRRRRLHESHQKLDALSSPDPEKSNLYLRPSRGSRKILTLTAFHSHDDRNRQLEANGQRSKEGFHVAASATPPPVRRSPSERKAEASDLDSPIDEESPFQLRHSETRRRSLGAEISDLWPSPPPTAWAKRQDILNQLPSSRFGCDMNRPRTQRFSSRKSQRDMRDINRPSIAEHWPLL